MTMATVRMRPYEVSRLFSVVVGDTVFQRLNSDHQSSTCCSRALMNCYVASHQTVRTSDWR